MSKPNKKKYIVPEDYKIQRLYRKREKTKRKLKNNMFGFLMGLLIAALIQAVIMGVFVFAFKSNREVAFENTEQITVKADSVEYRTLARTGKKASNNKLFIVCGSKEYLYQDLLSYHYDGDDLDEDLRTQTLTITLEKGTERVVDLRGEKDIFYTLDDYNKTARIRTGMGIGLLVVVELVYVAVFIVFLFCQEFPFGKIKRLSRKIEEKM